MVVNLHGFINRILYGKEGEYMMAFLWAQQIMKQDSLEKAKAMYSRVPKLLKEKVKEILIDSGCEDLTME